MCGDWGVEACWSAESGGTDYIDFTRRNQYEVSLTDAWFCCRVALKQGACGGDDALSGGIAGNGGEPFLPTEPGALAFGVLAGGNHDFFLAGIPVDLTIEETLELRDPDRAGEGGTQFREGSQFFDCAVIKHVRRPSADAFFQEAGIPGEQEAA